MCKKKEKEESGMKFYHMYESSDNYYEDGVKKTVSLRQGEVTLEEFQEYCEIFTKKVDYAVLGIDRIENDTLYFYSDIV
jgi:hypothetical protein